MGVADLQQLVETSGLSDQDKALWLRAFAIMDDEQAQSVLDAVADDASELEALTHNMKLKQIAFASGDDALLEQILQEESADVSHP